MAAHAVAPHLAHLPAPSVVGVVGVGGTRCADYRSGSPTAPPSFIRWIAVTADVRSVRSAGERSTAAGRHGQLAEGDAVGRPWPISAVSMLRQPRASVSWCVVPWSHLGTHPQASVERREVHGASINLVNREEHGNARSHQRSSFGVGIAGGLMLVLLPLAAMAAVNVGGGSDRPGSENRRGGVIVRLEVLDDVPGQWARRRCWPGRSRTEVDLRRSHHGQREVPETWSGATAAPRVSTPWTMNGVVSWASPRSGACLRKDPVCTGRFTSVSTYL